MLRHTRAQIAFPLSRRERGSGGEDLSGRGIVEKEASNGIAVSVSARTEERGKAKARTDVPPTDSTAQRQRRWLPSGSFPPRSPWG